MTEEERSSGGQLGRATSAKARCYHRLKNYVESQGSLFTQNLIETINELYEYPLRQSAIDMLNRKLKEGINDQQLVELVSNCRVAGMLSGKCGIAYFHVGSGPTMLDPLWEIVNKTTIPITQMYPTHMVCKFLLIFFQIFVNLILLVLKR